MSRQTLRRYIQRIADEEQRTITQVREKLSYEGDETYKKEGPKFMQHLVAKQKARVKDSWPQSRFTAAN